ncbi:unnamed protein product [Moneuplotes crassus]|uniref:Myb-like domain-containing protein n=1 Tax=Euplotes crassus TaxID=5936 RepID=A0AAD2D9I0_EUPCR|nr:unnamed protein product [Moneuplotes crassus]
MRNLISKSSHINPASDCSDSMEIQEGSSSSFSNEPWIGPRCCAETVFIQEDEVECKRRDSYTPRLEWDNKMDKYLCTLAAREDIQYNWVKIAKLMTEKFEDSLTKYAKIITNYQCSKRYKFLINKGKVKGFKGKIPHKPKGHSRKRSQTIQATDQTTMVTTMVTNNMGDVEEEASVRNQLKYLADAFGDSTSSKAKYKHIVNGSQSSQSNEISRMFKNGPSSENSHQNP